MARVKCPCCGRRFNRDPRALLANSFCRHCISERIERSGGKKRPKSAKLIEVTTGYFAFK